MKWVALKIILTISWSCSIPSMRREWSTWPMCTFSTTKRESSRFRSLRYKSLRLLAKGSTSENSNPSSTTKSTNWFSLKSTKTSMKTPESDCKTLSRCLPSCSKSQTPCSQSLTPFTTSTLKNCRRISRSQWGKKKTRRLSMISSALSAKRRPTSKMRMDGALKT